MDTARQEIARDRADRPGQQPAPDRPFLGIRIPVENTDNWVRDAEVNLIFPPLTRAAQRNLQELSVLGQEEATRRILRTALAQMPKVFFRFTADLRFSALHLFRPAAKLLRRALCLCAASALICFSGAVAAADSGSALPSESVQRNRGLSLDSNSPFVFGFIFLALKRVYGQGWLITGAKYFVLWLLYMSVFGVGVMVAAMLALTTI